MLDAKSHRQEAERKPQGVFQESMIGTKGTKHSEAKGQSHIDLEGA